MRERTEKASKKSDDETEEERGEEVIISRFSSRRRATPHAFSHTEKKGREHEKNAE